MSFPKQSSRNELIDNAIFIATIPGMLYLSAYIFEKQFCDYYHLDKKFIVIDLNLVLSYASEVLFWLSILASGLFIIAFFWQLIFKRTPRFVFFGFVTWFWMYLITQMWLYAKAPSCWLTQHPFIVLFMTALGCLSIGGFFVVYKKLLKKKSPRSFELPPDLFLLYENLFTKQGLFLTLLLLLPFFSKVFGEYKATTTTEFLTVGHPQLVVLRKYGDVYACRNYYSEKDSLADSVVLIRSTDTKKLSFGHLNGKLNFSKLTPQDTPLF